MKLSAIGQRVAVDAVKWAPKSAFSGIVGWGARRTLPRSLRAPIYETFARVVGAELGEVELSLSQYGSLGAFFSRGLRPGARQLAGDENAWVAPCDGRVVEAESLGQKAVHAKGRGFSLGALLASESLASAFDGGDFVTIYLSPRDYHRVHAPIDCRLLAYHYVPGHLYPVAPFYVEHIDEIFSTNERVVLEFESDRAGTFALVMVGAAGVGNLRLTRPEFESRHLRQSAKMLSVRLDEPLEVQRGDELGAFELGSTVILCTGADAIDMCATVSEPIQFGETLALHRQQGKR